MTGALIDQEQFVIGGVRMNRLAATRLAELPASVRRPAYDRGAAGDRPRLISASARFIAAISLTISTTCWRRASVRGGWLASICAPPPAAFALAPQACLYTRTLRRDQSSQTRVIGCLKGLIEMTDAATADAALAALAAPATHVVTLTITEKGYGLTPARGELNRANADVAADLGGAWPPRTALGLLTRALERRARDDAGPITLLSCDNIPANGRRLCGGLLAMIDATRPALAGWVEANVSFPCAMVDRIVPAVTAEEIAGLAANLGVRDEAAVFGEPFRQWVIEDRFAGPRPPWDLAGAQFVADAEPYEHVKMRVLNAAQSTLSHWGALVGFEFSHQAAADGVLSGLVERMLARETLPTLPQVEGMATDTYLETSLARIRNRAIRHRCHQIGTDGSQKIAQRLLAPLRVRRERGQAAPDLECAVAGWIAYVAAGARRYGARWTASDPFASEIIDRAERAASFRELADAALGLAAIFGDDLREAPFVARIAGHLTGLLGPDAHSYLKRALADG